MFLFVHSPASKLSENVLMVVMRMTCVFFNLLPKQLSLYQHFDDTIKILKQTILKKDRNELYNLNNITAIEANKS